MQNILAVIIGGAIGSLLRYLVYIATKGEPHQFPWGTLIVNLIGAFAIGIFWGIAENWHWPMWLRVFLLIGILGGFTTFSSFSLEAITLFKSGAAKLALVYIFISNLAGVGLAYSGLLLSRFFR